MQNIFLKYLSVFKGKNIYPGSGIGLAFMPQNCTQSPGVYYAEGVEEQGAVFHVIFPRAMNRCIG